MAERWVTVRELNELLGADHFDRLRTADEFAVDTMVQTACAAIDRAAERDRQRQLGVDPGRVIDGEVVRKEIEG